MRNILRNTLCALTIALSWGCQPESIVMSPNAGKKVVHNPVSKNVEYSLTPAGFMLFKKFKNGKEVKLWYNGSTLKVMEDLAGGGSTIMHDADLFDEGIESITYRPQNEVCLTFEATLSETRKCTDKEIREKNKLFQSYLQILGFEKHKAYWDKTKKPYEGAKGFDLYKEL